MLLEQTKVPLSKKQARRPPDGTPGARIFDLRRENENDADFAARLGLSQQALGEMAKGKGWPNSDTLARIVRASGADPRYLLLGDESVELRGRDRESLEQIAAIVERALSPRAEARE